MSVRSLHLADPSTKATAAGRRPAPVRSLVARGLADRWRAVLAWGIGGGLMCAFTAGVYPSIQDSLRQALDGYPAGLKEAFSIGKLSSVEEYLSAEAFGWIVPIAVSFFAIRSVVRSIAAAEEAGHLDALLAAPVSRTDPSGPPSSRPASPPLASWAWWPSHPDLGRPVRRRPVDGAAPGRGGQRLAVRALFLPAWPS